MTGGPDRWLRISLPEEITAFPEHSRIEQVAEIIRQHHAERKGWAGPFGRSPATTTGPSSRER